MQWGLKLIGVLTHIDFLVVGWLSDYCISLSLKGERLFHTKNTRLFGDDSKEKAATITLRLSADCSLLYIGLSKASHLTTLRLFRDYSPGETTTIGYDYSSRNATTVADLYWLSGESPKRDTAVAVNGSARRAPAVGLPRRVREASRRRQADPVQVETLTPPGWHGLRYAAALIYIIIIGRLR